MTRAFQAAYVDLDTPDAQQEVACLDRAIGATFAERVDSELVKLKFSGANRILRTRPGKMTPV